MPAITSVCVSLIGSPLRQDVEQDLTDARVVLLAEPEDGLLAHLGILVALRDLHELVRRAGVARLGEHPDELLLHAAVGHAIVERHELAAGDTRLAGRPERM